MLKSSKKVIGLTTALAFLASFVAGGPQLAGWAYLFPYLFTIAGVLAGNYAANALWSSLDKRKRQSTVTVSICCAFTLFFVVLTIALSRVFLNVKGQYEEWQVVTYFFVVFLVSTSTSALTYFSAGAASIFRAAPDQTN